MRSLRRADSPLAAIPKMAAEPNRSANHSIHSATLADVLERVLDKGLVIAGDIKIKLLDIDLLTIQIRLVVASVDKAARDGSGLVDDQLRPSVEALGAWPPGRIDGPQGPDRTARRTARFVRGVCVRSSHEPPSPLVGAAVPSSGA